MWAKRCLSLGQEEMWASSADEIDACAMQEDFRAGRGVELLNLETLNGACMQVAEACKACGWTACADLRNVPTAACRPCACSGGPRRHQHHRCAASSPAPQPCIYHLLLLSAAFEAADDAASALERLAIPPGTVRVIFKTLNTKLCAPVLYMALMGGHARLTACRGWAAGCKCLSKRLTGSCACPPGAS